MSRFSEGLANNPMKQKTKASFARRWSVGSIVVVLAGAPFVAAHLSQLVDSNFPHRPWLSFVCWSLVMAGFIWWPSVLPDLLRTILEDDAGLEEGPDAEKVKAGANR
jgi:hypothetical protein